MLIVAFLHIYHEKENLVAYAKMRVFKKKLSVLIMRKKNFV